MDKMKNESMPAGDDMFDACLLDEPVYDDSYYEDLETDYEDLEMYDFDSIDEEDDNAPRFPVFPKGILKAMWKGSHNPTLYREEVIMQIMAVLIGKDKPNTLLVGSAGCGKTQIVEELAVRMNNKDERVPKKLRGCRIYSLDMSAMLADTGLRGQLEEKIMEMIEFISNPFTNAILFIDEAHMLFGNASYKTVAEMLKPALSRGEIRLIAATTTQEVRVIEQDPAFYRRLTKVPIDELTGQQTLDIVKRVIPVMEEHYGIRIRNNERIPGFIVRAADEMNSVCSHRPDNALTLLDRTIANLVVAEGGDSIRLTESAIEKTAYQMTSGNSSLRELDENALRKSLSRIRGQEKVIDRIMEVIKLHDLHVRPRKTPLTLLFAGPSGVGKSEIARILAREYTHEKPIILNMAEYNSPASINRMIGAPAGYIGSDSKSELPFDALDTNPYRLILLDEFEKCDRSVQRLFLSAFDDGFIKTNFGKEIDFSKAIIIATTNAGCTSSSNAIGFGASARDDSLSVSDLSKFFDVELLGRFSHRYTFAGIDRKTYEDIVRDLYARAVAELDLRRFSASVRKTVMRRLDEKVIETIVKKTYQPSLGARPAKSAVTEYIDTILLTATEKSRVKISR